MFKTMSRGTGTCILGMQNVPKQYELYTIKQTQHAFRQSMLYKHYEEIDRPSCADIMFNMRSFANFQKLRNSEHAQIEIRDIAREMLELVKTIDGNPFKHTLEAWGI